MKHSISRRGALRKLPSLILASCSLLLPTVGRAHRNNAGAASTASSLALSLPVAALSVAPVMILGAGVALTVIAVEVTASGTVWLLERASDGVTASLRFAGEVATASAVAAGTMISVTVVAAGWLLSVAGEVLCLIPNALGESLLYNERVR